MIELINKLTSTRDSRETSFYQISIDNEIIPKIEGLQTFDSFAKIHLYEEFNFKYLLNKLGNCKINSLVSYEKKAIPFMIGDDSGNYYEWEKLFFSSQSISIIDENKKSSIYFIFTLDDIDLSRWSYEHPPISVLSQLSLINHENIDIHINVLNQEYSSLEIYLKDEHITTLSSSYNELKKAIYEVEQELYKRLETFKWKEEYHTKEPKFTKEVMIPLLKKMKYKNVRYNHGVDEHGKDVIFSEINKFGEEIFYAVQIKAGDISGGSNSDINTLVNQAKRAFTMPFKLLGEKHERHLSFFIIAISGHFTRIAKDVIVQQIERPYKQNVFFWDKDSIEDLIDSYWKED